MKGLEYERDRHCRARGQGPRPLGMSVPSILSMIHASMRDASGSIPPLPDRAFVASDWPPAVGPAPERVRTFGRNGQPVDLEGEGPSKD